MSEHGKPASRDQAQQETAAERIEPTVRTKVNRYPARGNYDRNAVEAILDEAMVCHVGFAIDGQPYVMPTIHARDGARIFIHGSPMSRTSARTRLETMSPMIGGSCTLRGCPERIPWISRVS